MHKLQKQQVRCTFLDVPRGAGPRLSLIIAGASMLWLLAGCATTRTSTITEMVWPEPPLAPRIKFIGLLRNQRDLGRSARDLFAEAVLGPQQFADSLQQPMGVAASRDGKRLYVTDYTAPGVFQFDFDTRRVSRFGETTYGFKAPHGIAVDSQDNVYVVDSAAKAVRVFDPQGRLLRTITHESVERPTGIAIDSNRGKVYVADSATVKSPNHVVRVFDLSGNLLNTIGTQGTDPGKFSFPTYLAIDANSHLYVTDTMNGRVQVFDPDGRYVKTIGKRGDAYGMFDKPKGIALDSFGNIYVVDSSWSNVQIFNQEGQVLLFFGGRGRFPGFLFNPTGLAIDKDNRIYVADAFNSRIGIYQLMNTKAEDSTVTAPAQAPVHAAPGKPSVSQPSASDAQTRVVTSVR